MREFYDANSVIRQHFRDEVDWLAEQLEIEEVYENFSILFLHPINGEDLFENHHEQVEIDYLESKRDKSELKSSEKITNKYEKKCTFQMRGVESSNGKVTFPSGNISEEISKHVLINTPKWFNRNAHLKENFKKEYIKTYEHATRSEIEQTTFVRTRRLCRLMDVLANSNDTVTMQIPRAIFREISMMRLSTFGELETDMTTHVAMRRLKEPSRMTLEFSKKDVFIGVQLTLEIASRAYEEAKKGNIYFSACPFNGKSCFRKQKDYKNSTEKLLILHSRQTPAVEGLYEEEITEEDPLNLDVIPVQVTGSLPESQTTIKLLADLHIVSKDFFMAQESYGKALRNFLRRFAKGNSTFNNLLNKLNPIQNFRGLVLYKNRLFRKEKRRIIADRWYRLNVNKKGMDGCHEELTQEDFRNVAPDGEVKWFLGKNYSRGIEWEHCGITEGAIKLPENIQFEKKEENSNSNILIDPGEWIENVKKKISEGQVIEIGNKYYKVVDPTDNTLFLKHTIHEYFEKKETFKKSRREIEFFTKIPGNMFLSDSSTNDILNYIGALFQVPYTQSNRSKPLIDKMNHFLRDWDNSTNLFSTLQKHRAKPMDVVFSDLEWDDIVVEKLNETIRKSMGSTSQKMIYVYRYNPRGIPELLKRKAEQVRIQDQKAKSIKFLTRSEGVGNNAILPKHLHKATLDALANA